MDGRYPKTWAGHSLRDHTTVDKAYPVFLASWRRARPPSGSLVSFTVSTQPWQPSTFPARLARCKPLRSQSRALSCFASRCLLRFSAIYKDRRPRPPFRARPVSPIWPFRDGKCCSIFSLLSVPIQRSSAGASAKAAHPAAAERRNSDTRRQSSGSLRQ